ncbi:MAG: c-type cytochrome [Alphaproteobacteria bacterium]|nr:c-type cytochrome [Alphaproteobacteria bacterium]
MSKHEPDMILGHSEESDGIEEYDNALPLWWLYLFYFTIAFAVVYVGWYHFVAKTSQASQYQTEMAAAAERWPQEEIVVNVEEITEDTVAEGKAIYEVNCIGCHGPELKGGIGPNLTDAEWIHGGTIEEITNTITNGVVEKGMLAWGPILGPQKIAQVASFVYSSGGGVAPSGAAEPDAAPAGDAASEAPADGAPAEEG